MNDLRDQTSAVAFLHKMLEISSVSGQEGELAEFLAREMQELGLESHIDEVGNAIGHKAGPPSDEPYQDIVLLGHMDTVPGDIPVRREAERLYGRGAVDAKGPLATFIHSVEDLEVPMGIRLIIIGAVEEESATSAGARHVSTRLKPQACIIGEPSHWQGVTLGYKGRLMVEYHQATPSSHSAGPEPNAIELATKWWKAVSDHCESFNQGETRLFHQLQTTLHSLNSSNDGLQDKADAIVGFRLPPAFDTTSLERELGSMAGSATLRFFGHEQAFQYSRSSPLARLFSRTIARYGGRPAFKLKTGTSDMNVVGPVWNCPVVAYGPGDSRLDHTPKEHILVPEFLKAIEILREVLEGLCLELVRNTPSSDPGKVTEVIQSNPRGG